MFFIMFIIISKEKMSETAPHLLSQNKSIVAKLKVL